MIDEQIRIEKIKVKDLYDFACRTLCRATNNDVIPITKHRALAHTNNPCADKNDIGLLVAYIGNQCIGYRGLMPGLLKRNNQFSKVYWLSTWFIAPEFRGKSFGSLLMRNALSLKYDLISTGMSNKAEPVYRHLGFQELGSIDYYIIDIGRLNLLALTFRLLQKVLSKMGVKSQLIVMLIKISNRIFSPFIKRIFYRILMCHHRGYIENVSYKEVNEIHEDATNKQAKYNATSTEFYRGTNIINWMLQYKWILEQDKAGVTNLNYYFSNVRDVFKYIALKVYSTNGEDYKGFMVLSVSSQNLRTVLKILDFHFSNYADYKYALFLALKYAKTYLADHIELPNSFVVPYIKKSMLIKFLLYKKKRIYLCYPKNKNSLLASTLNNVHLNYCDGDIAFT